MTTPIVSLPLTQLLSLLLVVLLVSPLVCEALSGPGTAVRSSLLGNILGSKNNNSKNNNGVSIEFFDPSDSNNDRLVDALRECRRTAFDPDKQNWLNSERDFVAAKSVFDGKNLCAIARRGNTVLGTADLQPARNGKKNLVTNVFVRPDQRGKGIGRRLMAEGIEEVLANELPEANLVVVEEKRGDESESKTNKSSGKKSAVLSLDVYTQNKPAITLYKDLGYDPSSPVHAGTLALADLTGANLVVSMSKTVPVVE
eukprot:CAMPEP_0201149572 /NCGR_PEP_ID=MMETSP0851-20130426/10845_1 /ASSEMBLY_ACC=CAM_ASM_000631 /TAXON_ID=183588 /ORGANISM="Pseudo-nitzschia fraudulenta, Strain WWA7" /LENGTH=255 /DNA_ID=CAMNT_0047425997 /DNA_START=23 /DNA_END=790 /DNA_ORIENTATION=+